MLVYNQFLPLSRICSISHSHRYRLFSYHFFSDSCFSATSFYFWFGFSSRFWCLSFGVLPHCLSFSQKACFHALSLSRFFFLFSPSLCLFLTSIPSLFLSIHSLPPLSISLPSFLLLPPFPPFPVHLSIPRFNCIIKKIQDELHSIRIGKRCAANTRKDKSIRRRPNFIPFRLIKRGASLLYDSLQITAFAWQPKLFIIPYRIGNAKMAVW